MRHRAWCSSRASAIGPRHSALGTQHSALGPASAYTTAMLAELLLKWPLVRQILEGGDGTGAEAMSDRTNALRPKHDDAEVARSICPYCAVGCGQLIYHRDGKIISIEGDP